MEYDGIYFIRRHWPAEGHSYPYNVTITKLLNGKTDYTMEFKHTHKTLEELGDVEYLGLNLKRVTKEQFLAELNRRIDTIAAFRYEG